MVSNVGQIKIATGGVVVVDGTKCESNLDSAGIQPHGKSVMVMIMSSVPLRGSHAIKLFSSQDQYIFEQALCP